MSVLLTALVTAIVETFAPQVAAWIVAILKSWLGVAANLHPGEKTDPAKTPEENTAVLFDRAIELARGHPLHWIILAVFRHHAVRHAPAIATLAADPTAPVPMLDKDEVVELSFLKA